MTAATILTPGTDPELLALLERARNHVMTPEEIAAQRASFVRAMMPAGHDMTVDQIRARLSEVEASIADAECWGAMLSEANEERHELLASLKAKGGKHV